VQSIRRRSGLCQMFLAGFGIASAMAGMLVLFPRSEESADQLR
jgi:hypothetical protein